MAPTKTLREKHTERVEARLRAHLQKDWRDLLEGEPFSPSHLSCLSECPPRELWMYRIQESEKHPGGYDIYLIWDGREVFSLDDIRHAISAFTAGIREEKTKERFLFFSTPIIISGILSTGLLILIAALSFFHEDGVPVQLWSIFTAVIAFYFGTGARKAKQKSGSEPASG